MAKLEWRASEDTTDLWPSAFTLHVKGIHGSKWYATMRYEGWIPPTGAWTVLLRDWVKFEHLLDYPALVTPPREYVESLVRLAYDIGDING